MASDNGPRPVLREGVASARGFPSVAGLAASSPPWCTSRASPLPVDDSWPSTSSGNAVSSSGVRRSNSASTPRRGGLHRGLPGMEAAMRPEHNEAVRVAVRVRPFTERDKRTEGNPRTCAVSMVGQSTRVRTEEGLLQFSSDITFWSHDPQGVGHSTQEDVFNDLGMPLLRSGLSGYSGCLVAYGQTSAGKSHSVIGTSTDPGILPRLVDGLLQERSWAVGGGTGGSSAGGFELRVWFSAIEIYSERVRDLLSPIQRSERTEEPAFVEHPTLGVQVVGAVEAPCLEATDARQLLDYTFKKRAATVVNVGGATSSRTHAIFSIRLDVRQGDRSMHARLMLADLAGSERRFREPSLRKPCRDGRAINHSLAVLGLVVRELAESGQAASRTCPFPASKLTLGLKDAFAGNSRTWFLACLAPGTDCAEETAATLRFAESVRHLRTTPRPQYTSWAEALSVLQEDAFRLRVQLFSDSEFDNLPTELTEQSGELTERQRILNEIRRPRQPQADEGVGLAREREKALEAAGLLLADAEEAFSLEQVTPYLMNMSDDPMLAGRLLYFLRRGAETSIGSASDSTIVINGLGVVSQVCIVVNHDNVRVTLQRKDECKRNVLLNGEVLLERKNGEVVSSSDPVQICHHDRLFLGRAVILRLHVPMQAEVETIDESQEHITRPPPPINELVLGNYVREALPRLPDRSESFKQQLQPYMEHSESFSELQLYMEDLYEKLDSERGHAFFKTLQEACHVVDEANMITREVRPEDRLHFEVEFVWDIYRDVEDILMIRVMCFDDRDREGRAGDTRDQGTVLHYWTYWQFRERLDMMRDVYLVFHRTGEWPGRDDSLDDPWGLINPAIMQQRLLLAVNAERRRALADRPTSPADPLGRECRKISPPAAASDARPPNATKMPAGVASLISADQAASASNSRMRTAKVGKHTQDRRSDSAGRARQQHLQQRKGGTISISGLVPPGGVGETRAAKASHPIVVGPEYGTTMDVYNLTEAEMMTTATGSRLAAAVGAQCKGAPGSSEEAEVLKEQVSVLQHQLAALKEKTDYIDDMRDQMQFMQSMLSTVPSGLGSSGPGSTAGSVAAGSTAQGDAVDGISSVNTQKIQGIATAETRVETASDPIELVELSPSDSVSVTPSAPEAPCGSPQDQAVPAAVPMRVTAAAAPRPMTPIAHVRHESSPRPDSSGLPLPELQSHRNHYTTGQVTVYPAQAQVVVQAGQFAHQSRPPWAHTRTPASPPRSQVRSPVPSPVLHHRVTDVETPGRTAAGGRATQRQTSGEQRIRVRSGSGSGSRSRNGQDVAGAVGTVMGSSVSTSIGSSVSTSALPTHTMLGSGRFPSPMPTARGHGTDLPTFPSYTAPMQPAPSYTAAGPSAPTSPAPMARILSAGSGSASPVTFVTASASTSSLHGVQAGQPIVRQVQPTSYTPSPTPRVALGKPQGR